VPGVVIDQATSTFSNMAPGASATNSSVFKIHFAGGFDCGTNADFTLSVTTTSDGNFSIPFRLGTTSTAGAPVRFNNNTSTPLVDVAVTDIPFTVSGFTGAVAKVTVSFYATHTFDSDLQISLVGPDNTAVLLSNLRGGAGQNFGTACSPDSSRTTFDDAAGTAIGVASAPFVGSFRPDQPLSAFNAKSGSALNGTWKLRFEDTAPGDSGVFLCGSIVITPAVCVTGGSCASGPTFTDDPLTVGVTVVKAVHIAELRTRIDAQRVRFGLGGYAWTDQPLTVGTVIKSQHVLQLRTALNEAYAAHGVSPPAPSYTDPGLPGGTLVKAQHITELRNAVIALEGV
jgi:subtilisin-like proprotein convertase family protein